MSVARNTIYNIAGSAVPILVSLATVPLYVHVVGLERYGLLSICWLFLGYFGLFDLGLGRAAAQRIGSLAGAPPEERSRVFWTAFLLTLALGLVAMLVLWPAVHFALPLVQTESAGLRQEVAGAAPWLALCVPITLLSGLFNGALTGRERFAFVNVIDASSNLLMSLLPLGLAYWFDPAFRFSSLRLYVRAA